MDLVEHTTASQAPQRWPLATVLVVDDEPGMRNFIEKSLAPRVAQVLSAESAEAADELVQRHRFDLVVLDIELGRERHAGVAIINAINKSRQGTPVLVVSAMPATKIFVIITSAEASLTMIYVRKPAA